jgi:hypothetical protein
LPHHTQKINSSPIKPVKPKTETAGKPKSKKMKRQIFIAVAFIAATVSTTKLAAQTTAETLKTRTKSNNANEKTTQPAGTENAASIKLQTPASGKEFTVDQTKNAITFRWTPVVPKPKEGVTYRLKVWQLMQGQNSTQAMRTNKPIVTKDVMDITQAAVSGIYTGPCRPPYLCDYIWTVQAIAADGKPITENTTPDFFSFTVTNTGTVPTSPISTKEK